MRRPKSPWRTGEVRASLPADADEVFALAVRAARVRTGPSLSAGQALFIMSVHFTDVWARLAVAQYRKADEVMKRDGGRCQVPGCSHRANHVHHVRFRSHGGPTTPDNLVAVCEAHHLAGIHAGYLRVTGTAPDGLVWEFLDRDAIELALLFPEDPAEREGASAAAACRRAGACQRRGRRVRPTGGEGARPRRGGASARARRRYLTGFPSPSTATGTGNPAFSSCGWITF